MRARGLLAALLLAAAAVRSTLPAGPDGAGAVARPVSPARTAAAKIARQGRSFRGFGKVETFSTHLHLRGGAADDESKRDALSIGDAAKQEVANLLRERGVSTRERGSRRREWRHRERSEMARGSGGEGTRGEPSAHSHNPRRGIQQESRMAALLQQRLARSSSPMLPTWGQHGQASRVAPRARKSTRRRLFSRGALGLPAFRVRRTSHGRWTAPGQRSTQESRWDCSICSLTPLALDRAQRALAVRQYRRPRRQPVRVLLDWTARHPRR